MVFQGKKNLELDLQNWQSKYEQEVAGHKNTMDEKYKLLSSEETTAQILEGMADIIVQCVYLNLSYLMCYDVGLLYLMLWIQWQEDFCIFYFLHLYH